MPVLVVPLGVGEGAEALGAIACGPVGMVDCVAAGADAGVVEFVICVGESGTVEVTPAGAVEAWTLPVIPAGERPI